MKKLMIATFLLMAMSAIVNGQEKTGIGIAPFTYVDGAAIPQDVNAIQAMVINSFMKTRRFNVIEPAQMDALKRIKGVDAPDDVLDVNVLQRWGNLGAQFVISGQVVSAQAEQMRADDGQGTVTITYKAKVILNLKVTDVATGQTINAETLEPKAGSSMLGSMGIGSSSPENAITKAIKTTEDKIDDFVGRNFPISFSIAEVQEKDKKGNATTILIAGGSAHGLKKGDKLKVVELTDIEVNGKKMQRKKEIGELKITKVEDENFSICSVSAGGLEINTKFEAKAKLQIITKD
ncbi:MAG: hypothetical protein NTW10_08745 [Bacteroidetes bacterium]|nr:hypothetical protein [Bacteroidota bacterium]